MVWLGPGSSEQGGPTVVAEGIFASTLIATPEGWRPAGALSQDSMVLTFDSGAQPVAHCLVAAVGEAPSALWPLSVPAWALDNREEVLLLPEQKILIETDLAETLYGDPFALIPGQALEGWRGITRCRPPVSSAVVHLGFTAPQVIYASRGILLSCPGEPMAEPTWDDRLHTSYSLTQARHLIACLMAEEAGAALRSAGRHLNGAGL